MKRTRSHGPQESDRSTAEMDRRAADWLARKVAGLTPTEQAEFADWLKADARHELTFRELQGTWSALGRMDEMRLPDGRPLDVSLPPEPRRSRRPWLTIGLAAAAAVAFLLAKWPTFPETAMLAQSVATEAGGFQRVDLSDGSVIRLNGDSTVDVVLDGRERRVQLIRGEANFTVAKDHNRPFVVYAGQIKVHAIGTAFNVRLDERRIEVLVTEGRVRVDDVGRQQSLLAARTADSDPLLLAGERVMVPVLPTAMLPEPVAIEVISPEEMRSELSWQERQLVFADTPLEEIVAEFNRYNGNKLVLVDPRIRQRRFGGTFRADSADAFVRLLESRFNIRAERTSTRTLLRLEE